MLLDLNQTCLILIDVQEKLIPLIHNYQQLVENCRWLIELANELHVPVIATEQYPKGLGHTISQFKNLNLNVLSNGKQNFSCASDSSCSQAINAVNKSQIILIGIEAHVCVMQAAIELSQTNKQIFVVADAVGSRDENDKLLALQRMRKANIEIISKEMVFFEWMRTSAHPKFRELSKKYL